MANDNDDIDLNDTTNLEDLDLDMDETREDFTNFEDDDQNI